MYAADNLPATGKIGKELVDALKSLKVYPEEGKSGPFTKTADECAAFQPGLWCSALMAEAFNFLCVCVLSITHTLSTADLLTCSLAHLQPTSGRR
jgi:hypothetical protein